jgi:NADH-quinone oxidoreductase subunit G
MTFDQMLDAAIDGTLKAMIIAVDNPLMFAPDRARVDRALASLDLLIVIDSMLTETAAMAHVVFADVPSYAKAGTYTNAERRVNRLHAALDARGDARPALLALTDLANALKTDAWAYTLPDAVTDEIAATRPGYERFTSSFTRWSTARAVGDVAQATPPATPGDVGQASPPAVASDVARPTPAANTLTLTTGRTLYTSLEGAAVRSGDADKLHREEFVELHPSDAASLGVTDGDDLLLQSDAGELAARVSVSARVLEGVAFLPSYYDGGAVTRLLDRTGAPARTRVRVATPA